MEREITGIKWKESFGSMQGALYDVHYVMSGRKYQLSLYARDELHAYQKFKEVVGNRTTKRKEA